MASKSFDKLIEEIGTMSVFELSDFVKALETKFGVSAAMPVMGAMPAGAAAEAGAAKAEEKSEYKVTLEALGEGVEKIKIIKALRQAVPNLGLTEAKETVEGAPKAIAEAASKEDAKKMKEVLEAAGAKVTLS